MQLDIYWTTLLILLPAVVLLTGRRIIFRPLMRIQTKWGKVDTDEKPESSSSEPGAPPPGQIEDGEEHHTHEEEEVGNFRYAFLSVYLLVMSSEWLSGPYLYPLLRDDKALPESVVIGLYATAYTSAAVSATVTGFLADRYGRRRAGMAQCGIHVLACLTVIFGGDCLPVLFVGRVLAGTALTLLWTVFESWMVTEWNARDGRIWALTFVTCCFEGTTFLIIFLWPSVLQHAHLAKTDPDNPNEIPYGVIFAALMAAMILGALLFNASSERGVPPAWLLMSGVMVAILSLLLLAVLGGEIALFCAFLLFEVANGLYVPSMAYLRGLVVDEKSRTGMYGLMRIPLFIFVILALGITAEGSRFKRLVFASASVCLLLAAIALVIGFGLVTMIKCPVEPTYSLTGDVEVFEEGEREDMEKDHEFYALNSGAQFAGKEVMMLDVSVFLCLFVGERLCVTFQSVAVNAFLVVHVVVGITAKVVEIHLVLIVIVLLALSSLFRSLLLLNILLLLHPAGFLLFPPLVPCLLKLFDLFFRLVDILVPHDLAAAESFLNLGEPELHPRSELNELDGPTLHFMITMDFFFFLLVLISSSGSGGSPCSCDLLPLVSLENFDLGICVRFTAARGIGRVSVTILATNHVVCDILELAEVWQFAFPALAVH
ncbi:hypothetical protein VMCG_07023 [Cytospora schulzeri]|uniref:Molybdate-anion transporter n=1 Tax=Cytospora schulzeri TaxID=448051 RepID=A0A423W3V4_9PEZI|nr:hypothetical protein VMCG_07023 [Valsa malicola]